MDEQTIFNFFSYRDKTLSMIRGNKKVYDVKGYYKYLDESELFDYYLKLI